MHQVDVAIVGGGPAGLSAALNLARSRHRVVLFDANRPRNAATLASHGFLSRDGVSPLELRRLGREELVQYPKVEVLRERVEGVERVEEGFRLSGESSTATARILVVASGLREELPAFPSIRAHYGMSLHSCLVCDGFEKRDQPLALIGETDDLAERAILVSRWSSDLVVFTNGVAELSAADEAMLAERGIRVERRPIADVEGDREGLTGIRLTDGEVIARSSGFIRPRYVTGFDYLEGLGLATDAEGFIEVDAYGRTSVPWVYAAGDVTPPGPKQLIIAAGAGAMVAGGINRDELLGWRAGA